MVRFAGDGLVKPLAATVVVSVDLERIDVGEYVGISVPSTSTVSDVGVSVGAYVILEPGVLLI